MSERRDPVPAGHFYLERFEDAGDEDDSLYTIGQSIEDNHQAAFVDFLRHLEPAGKEPIDPSLAESARAAGRQQPTFVYVYRRADLEKAWRAVAHLLRRN